METGTPTTRPLHTASAYIHPLTARFRDPTAEQAFLDHIGEATRRHLLIAFPIWAMLLIIFALPDYVALGPGRESAVLLATRGASAAMILGFALACVRWPRLALNFPAITLVELLAATAFFLVFILRPDVLPYNIAVTMVMLVGLYLMIPNLVTWNSVVAGYLIAGTTYLVWLQTGAGLLTLTSLLVVYLLPLITGLVVANRLQALRRSQFALLTEAQLRNTELEREVQRRQALEAELQQQAATDPLTGLLNRRGYELLFDQEFKRARRQDAPLAMAILDLDRFKHFNDTYGHGAGDEVLRSLANEWSQRIREPDILGRLGGEEFVMLMPDTRAADAVEVMERLRTHTQATPRQVGAVTVPVTVTIGVTEVAPSDNCFQDMIARADEALYKAKNVGRNQVMLLLTDDNTESATGSQQG